MVSVLGLIGSLLRVFVAQGAEARGAGPYLVREQDENNISKPHCFDFKQVQTKQVYLD